LAQSGGRHFDTLFSDEADGPLDLARKRMFMQMKREVLRLGAYGREYFVSQTPELVELADAVIDLDQTRGEQRTNTVGNSAAVVKSSSHHHCASLKSADVRLNLTPLANSLRDT
jgi:exonuclease SbcC